MFVQCQRYNDLRVPHFPTLYMLPNHFENQCDNQKFILAVPSTDPQVIKMVGKFVNAIFTLRESSYKFVFIFFLYTCFNIFMAVV